MARRGEAGSKASTAKAAKRPPSACVAIAGSGREPGRLEELIAALSTDAGAAYLVVADGEMAIPAADLAAALKALTAMPVKVATHDDPLERDCVYVADTTVVTTVENGRVTVQPPTEGAPGAGSIDSLLLSAAEAYEEAAIVVVLAGLGADGVAGVAATKRCGGLSVAEGSDDSLEPPDRAVTAAGIADLRVTLERIPREVAAYIAGLERVGVGERVAETLQDDVTQQIARIAAILRNGTGHDFHGYKHATFLRRIQRRMQVMQIEDLERYVDHLRGSSAEVQHLFQDLLIGVTQFFRDPSEFEVLEREVIPKLFKGKGVNDHLRVWVLGCATGEEAYSIAILLREHAATLSVAPDIQIFATDIDARALGVARGGRYAEGIARHMSPERLARWFIREGTTYSVSKELREMCIFSPHNLVRDAPFSRIDLISCRNLLIYLNSDLQDRVMPIFHFSLRSGGYMFLGPAENVTRHQKLFSPVDRKARMFRRLETSARVLPDFPFSRRVDPPETPAEAGWRSTPPRLLTGRLGRRVEQVAERYAPAYLVVDQNYDVLHFSGRTGQYLEPASGIASLNILNLVHRDLRLDLRSALQKAVASGEKVEAQKMRLTGRADVRLVDAVIEPIETSKEEGRTLMVLFQDAGPGDMLLGLASEPGAATDEHVQRLETELRATRERLQTTIEELESTNEELKSSNEEYQSINEELQSANEELETSKEELQAVNEELQTVNSELAHRVGELARSNSDLKNLLESTQIATIFLDNDLRLRSFTPASSDIFHLIEADVGRPIAHVAARVNYPELQDDARKVLKSLGQVEREVAGSDDDRRFMVRVLPYRSVDNFIAGVVVTFLEVTGTVRAEAALQASERRFSEAQTLAGVGVWEWNLESEQMWWSPVVFRLWGLPMSDTPPPVEMRPLYPLDRAAYDAAWEEAKRTGELNGEWRVVHPDGSLRWLAVTGRMEQGDHGRRMLGISQDVTLRKLTETRLRLLLGELQHRVRNILAVVRSIVGRTVRNATDLEDAATHLEGRLDTLARTQSVFTRTGEADIDLEEMIREEMLSVAATEAQLDIEGPPLRLRHEAAETFALAVHELTTNAIKYGALSQPSGRLSVHWQVLNTRQGRKLSLEWRESGVKALALAPSRTGFGRELIERGLPHELGATTSMEFRSGGVRASIEVPLNDKVAVLDDDEREDAHATV